MAKFFDDFRGWLGDLANSVKGGAGAGGAGTGGGGGGEEFVGASEEQVKIYRTLTAATDDYNTQLADLNEEYKKADFAKKREIEEQRLKIQEDLADTNKRLNDLNKETDVQVSKQIKREQDKARIEGKGYGDLSNVSGEYNEKIKDLFESQKTGKLSMGDFNKQLKGLKFESKALQGFNLMMGSGSGMFGAIGGMAAKGIGNMLMKVLPPQLQFLAKIAVAIVGAAFEQIGALNKQLVETLRNTGGVANSAMLGFDSMGNSISNTYGSLETQALKANVSAKEFGDSINKLFDKVPGQVAGLKDNLQASGDALQQYGIQAARLQKLYGADMSGSVGNLMSKFGMGISDSTKLATENADMARKAGLSVKETMKNLEAATALAGKFYMATTDQLTKLTFMATKLGVSVNSLAEGTIKMNGITGLFQAQQKTAALEMTNTANALAKVYALRAQGKGGEAAQVEMGAMAKDLMGKGMINKGQVSQQGIATMQAAGATQETINALARMARTADETGVSMQKMTNPEALTKSEKKKLDLAERNNRTLEEQLKMTFGGLKQTLVDPIAKIFGAVLKPILAIVEMIVGVIGGILETVFQFLDPVIGVIEEIFGAIGDTIGDILNPIKEMFSNIVTAVQPVMNMLKQIFSTIMSVIMVPIRIIGKILGSVFSVIGRIIKVVGEKLKPVFEWITAAFKGIQEWVGGLLDWIDSVLGWIVDVIGGIVGAIFTIIGGAFKVIGFILKGIWAVISGIWNFFAAILGPIFSFIGDVLGSIWDFFVMIYDAVFKPIIDFLKGIWEGITHLFDFWPFNGDDDKKTGGTELTPEMIDAISYGTPMPGGAPGTQNVTPTEVKDANDAKTADLRNEKEKERDQAAAKEAAAASKEKNPAFASIVNVTLDPLFPNKISAQGK